MGDDDFIYTTEKPTSLHIGPVPITDEMVERGARALYQAEGKPFGEWRDGRRKGTRDWITLEWDELSDGNRAETLEKARAVLRAALGVSLDRTEQEKPA
jgi:hypothetical protein